MSSYTLSENAEKFNLKTTFVFTALNDAIALGWDLIELCGNCEELELCLVLSITPIELRNYVIDIEGLYVHVSEDKIVDSKITLLFKHANYIVKEGRKVYFYVKKPYTLGVYYSVCRESGVSWSSYKYPSSTDLTYLSGGND